MAAPTALPTPRAPRTVQTLQWITRPYPYLAACRRRFGDVFTLRLHALGDVVMLARPEHVAAAWKLDGDVARTGEANAFMAPVLGEESLFLLDGEPHRERRAELRGTLADRPPIDPDLVQRVVREELPAAGGVIDANERFRWIALRLIGHRVLGTDRIDDLQPLAEAMKRVTGPLSAVAAFLPALQHDLGPSSPGYWFDRRISAFDDALAEIVDRQREAPDGSSVLASLVAERGGRGCPATAASLRDDLVTLIAAGDDTVATALSWTLFWIVRTPSVHRRLLDPAGGVPLGASSEQILSSRFLEATCMEALRISPVIDIVSRKTTAPVTLGDIEVPAGVLASPAIYLTHSDPEIYPNPAEFRPERFLGGRAHPAEYYPFGGGARRCLGAPLALFELRLVLGTILSEFEVLPCDRRTTRLRYSRRNVTVAPRDPFRTRLVRRSQA